MLHKKTVSVAPNRSPSVVQQTHLEGFNMSDNELNKSCEQVRSSGGESIKEMLDNSQEFIEMDYEKQIEEAELVEVVSTLYAKELKELGEIRFNHKTEVQINSHREE